MILTGEIENELHELLYFVRNHKEELKTEEKVQLAEMLVKATINIRISFDITSGIYIPAEAKVANEVICKREKDGEIHVY